MSKPWVDIRVKTEKNKMRNVQTRITGWPEEAFVKYYFQALQQLTSEAARVMKEYIASNAVSTETGQAQGREGRVKSGAMVDGIKTNASGGRGGIKQNNKYLFLFGRLDGTPGYAIFQEWGTQNGIKAMNSQRYAAEWARQELKSLGKGRVTSARKFI